MMKKLYLAAPIFTPKQLEVVERLKITAEDYGHEVFSPYHNSQGIFKGRPPMECTAEERRSVIDDNIRYLDWCDGLLAWVGGMGGFTDPGVIWEMGFAFHAGKFCVAYIDPVVDAERQSMNLMLSATIDAVTKDQVGLSHALSLLVQDDISSLHSIYGPKKVLGAETEPVV